MRASLLACVCLLVTGCVSTKVHYLDQAVRPARSPDSVTVLREIPDQAHTVVAVIESRGESVFDSFADMRNAMIAEAAQLGGDALILGPETTDESFISTGTALIRSDRKRLTGKVIVFDHARGG